MSKSEKIKRILKLLISFLGLTLLLFGGFFLVRILGWDTLSREEIQSFIESAGALGPLIYIFISFIQVTFIPIPGAITILAGNYVFGPVKAFLYSYIGMLLGSMLAFFLGRVIGRRFVDFITGSKDKTDEWIKKLKGRENVLLFFMFFLPLFPDDILCSVAGILPISTVGFLIMQLVTRTTSILGTLLFMSGEIIPYQGWGLPVLVVLGTLAVSAMVLSIIYADKITNLTNKIIDRVFPRRKGRIEGTQDAPKDKGAD